MSAKIYAPFERFNFSNKNCFLSGEALKSEEEKIQVFPQWLMSQYALEDKPFKMLDENIATYKDLKLPCSSHINDDFLEPLEEEIANVFEKGYEGVKALDELKLFQWAGKLLYGIIFNEIQSGIRLMHSQGEEFSMSQSILLKFSQLHLMLQSINLPIIFEDFKPFSIFLFKVNNNHEEFGYRDEINTQTFALRIKDFGMVICLQDNASNYYYHKKIYEQIKDETLHPIQFEEFSARVFYSNYLFNRLPEYNILPVNDEIYIEEMPLRGLSSKPLFDEWQNKTYGQVLENFWKNWGFLLLEIIKDPEHPVSYLFDKDGNKIAADSISLSL
ncbi:hypothetical protein FPZ42_17585 [Mucilaginibacter achroorhodeus]|uniref:Uncharacterized protein n=1 Tax=Mucilaginibacter achroorhodeus TaxID=2599294 RepID=A0A563U099_9SPHI|nr:hypothetical protein [Mucilaginibacter achroorhodeus]TWR24291.1 hypothetical protein FPZ42_17585 [Mucilaginibacter achroorhodeus]